MKSSIRVVRHLSLAALGIACLLPLACGSKDKPAVGPQLSTSASLGWGSASSNPPPNASYNPNNPPPPNASYNPNNPPPPPPSATAAPLGSVFTTDPNQLAALLAQAAIAGQALLQQPGMVAGDPVEAGIRTQAAKYAPGMQAEGQIAKGNLQENGHLEFMVPMQAGKCYAIVGFSPTVQNLDLNVLMPPFYNMLAGQDGTDNNTPVVGKTPNPLCPIIPMAVPYKVDIHARRGAGAVGVQVFSKTK